MDVDEDDYDDEDYEEEDDREYLRQQRLKQRKDKEGGEEKKEDEMPPYDQQTQILIEGNRNVLLKEVVFMNLNHERVIESALAVVLVEI